VSEALPLGLGAEPGHRYFFGAFRARGMHLVATNVIVSVEQNLKLKFYEII